MSTELRSGTSRIARLFTIAACLGSVCLIGTLLAFVLILFSSHWDVPPTWYWALTVVVVVSDAAIMCFLLLGIRRLLIGTTTPARLLRVALSLVLFLGAAHVTTVYALSKIPQWDYQGSLFDDLSWPGPGRISQECVPAPGQRTSPAAGAPTSPVPGAKLPTSVDEIRRIARIQDWRARYKELENRTAAGWRGWVQDVVRQEAPFPSADHHDPMRTCAA